MYEIVNVQYTGTYNNGGTSIPAVLGEFRASSAADLPAQNVDCHIICGCDGLDIATGDRYIWNGTAWILQPSDRTFSNVYTKPEIDSMITEIYGVIAYYHTVIVSDTGEITFYALAGYIGTWTIYGNGQQTGTLTPDNPVMPDSVGVRTGNLWSLYPNQTYRGVTFEFTNNTIKMNNTCTQEGNIGDAIDIKAGTYTIAANANINIPQNTHILQIYKSNVVSKTISLSDMIGGKASFTIAEDTTDILIRIHVMNGVDYSGLEIRPMLNSGGTALPYEPYGYKIPITCGGETNNVYLSAPLRKAIDGTDAVDTLESTGTITRNVDENGDALATPTTETIEVPAIPTVQGENTLTVDTDLPPSLIEISGGITHE